MLYLKVRHQISLLFLTSNQNNPFNTLQLLYPKILDAPDILHAVYQDIYEMQQLILHAQTSLT